MSVYFIETGKGDLLRLLTAVENSERLGALRLFLVHALALAGVPMWLGARGLFYAVALSALLAAALEWRWQRVKRACLRDGDVEVLDDDT